MGFLRDRRDKREEQRRQQYAASANWPLIANLMLMGHELGLAEEAGLPDDSDHPVMIRDAVLDRIGGWDHFIAVYIDCSYRAHAIPKSNDRMPRIRDLDELFEFILEESGYNRARAELFPDA